MVLMSYILLLSPLLSLRCAALFLQRYMQDEGKVRNVKDWSGDWKQVTVTPPKV